MLLIKLMTESDIMNVEQWLGKDNQLSLDIWHKKYQYENESFDEWLDRVSGGNPAIRKLIVEKKFLFGGRILANRNIPGNKTYSNCYVIAPPEDNLESIFDAAKKLARTFSYGGGCGIDIGKLCPKDARVNNTAKKSSGAVSFMDLYNLTTGLIGQNGRRGALMLSMPVNHPDIEDFVNLKSDLNKITNANISVRVDDNFMRAVQNDMNYELTFTRPESGETITKTVNAKELFHKICEMNWNYAEPGVLFWDRITNHNLLVYDDNFEYAGTNPCAEEPLPSGGSCLLGALNLSAFVKNPFTKDAAFNFAEFKQAIVDAVYALNEVLDEGMELHPLEEQRNSVRNWRQIGLGMMGLADCLIKLGIVYGSNDANELCDRIAKTMFENAISASQARSDDYGSYPMFNREAVNSSPMMGELAYYVDGLNNSQLLTIAPTGSIATMLGISGGIEPIFANSYTRRTQSLHGEDVVYKVYTPIVQEYMTMHNIQDESELPKEFVVAADISPENRIKCQAAWQKWIDASISSTINLPNEATVEDVENIYMYAWKCGLKGVTVYRAGCAREGILVTEETKKETEHNQESNDCVNDLARGYIRPATDDCIGKKRKLQTGCGSLHCAAFFDPITGDIVETYLSKGSTGGCANFMVGLSRMISLAARSGCSIHDIIDQLNSCGACPSYAVRRATKHDTSKGSCCPMAVGNALLDMWHEMQYEIKHSTRDIKIKSTSDVADSKTSKDLCPECGEPLKYEGGCISCANCAWSKCD
jgi:ribonucleoside-diphosphate reductase alpha chain